jgi:DNA-directed RNA polymerase subunit RPC12/RpoP
MKITTVQFENETYRCRECDKSLSENEVITDTWKCDECGKKILINKPNEKLSMVRLYPNEMTEEDWVFDQYTEKFYQLKGITFKGGNYQIGIKEYRAVKLKEDDLVNCMWNDQ